jgi:SSS family solute:Na+ symporter
MSTLDLVILVVYVGGVVGFGMTFAKEAATSDGFTAANRNLPGWLVGLSIFGTYLSSISFLALPGKAFADGFAPFAFSLSLPIAAYAAVRWFAPLYRASGDVSAYAYLERRFGLWARLYAMTCYLLTQLARMGTILYLVALAMAPFTGLDVAALIVAAGILVTAYTVIGGIEAVIWTDAVQSVVLTLGALVSVGYLFFAGPVPPGEMIATTAAAGRFTLGSFDVDLTAAGFWTVFVYGLAINLQNFGIDQSYIQRYQSASSLAEARRSVWVGALLYIPVSALFLLIGALLFAYYQYLPDRLPIDIAADKVFPHFIVDALPSGIVGLVIAALFSAAISSVDTSLNSSATILMSDVYLRFLRPDADERSKMRFLRGVSVGMGVLGTGAALLMISAKGALDIWWSWAGVFSGGMLGLFLLGAISRRARSREAAVGAAVGLSIIVWATGAGKFGWTPAPPFHGLFTVVAGTLALFAVGAILSRRRERLAKTAPARTLFDLD